MANTTVGWEVEGIISPAESVAGMLRVIETKDMRHTGTFWTWQGNVSVFTASQNILLKGFRFSLGDMR